MMTAKEIDLKNELWSTRFGFYYYNDHELLEADNDDLTEQARQFAESGINHVMTFSITHFRWSFQSSWPVIDSALKRIVNAFHKFNIKVTEHHSANYIFATPRNQAEQNIIDSRFSCRNSKAGNWPHFKEDMNINRDAGEGVSIKSLLQIDGNTGQPAYLDLYAGYYMCPNNPDFVRLYLNYLEEHIYPQGVDGIMTDDISNCCACQHCRKLFHERTGYELPSNGQSWTHWLQDEGSPSYRAWMKFRLTSCNDFHLAVKQHYEALGLRMRRPNYIATAISFTYFACLQNFDDLPALDWAFQENNFSDIIRYSWPEWRVEAAHRRMVAGNRNIPAMSMFYPDRQDTVNFGWALAMSWGQKYVATTHNADVNQNIMEKQLRNFEIKHADLLNRTQMIAKLAFYDSYDNRIVYRDYNNRSAALISSWTQACTHRNIPWVMINKQDLAEIETFSAIVLPEVGLLTDNELIAFQQYIKTGGHIIWLGNCAVLDATGAPRHPETISSLLDINEFNNPEQNNISQCYPSGEGILQTHSFKNSIMKVETRKTIHQRWLKGDQEERLSIEEHPFATSEEKIRRHNIIDNLIQQIPSIECLKVQDAPEDLLITPYQTLENELAIHIVNATGTLQVPSYGTIAHSDPIPMPQLKNDVTIILKPANINLFTKAILLRPGKEKMALKISCNKEEIKIVIPTETITYYGLIHVT